MKKPSRAASRGVGMGSEPLGFLKSALVFPPAWALHFSIFQIPQTGVCIWPAGRQMGVADQPTASKPTSKEASNKQATSNNNNKPWPLVAAGQARGLGRLPQQVNGLLTWQPAGWGG